MRFLRCLYIFLMTFFAASAAQEIPAPASFEILNYIDRNLPHQGTLKNSNGFVYVDLDDEYVHKLIALIQQEGFEEPPYFGDPGLVGAHITVMYPEEAKKYGVKEIDECGEMISFTPKKCQVVHPPRWKEIDEVYFVVVEAPELDQVREKYGLPKREYDFHITIGVKPKMTTHLSCEVAVIGSGLAGLAAAEHLKTQGYDVRVIEAENRVGGRVLTCHLPEDAHFELGPFSFGDGEQPLWDYVHRFELPIIKHTQMEKIFWFKDWTGKMSEKGSFLNKEEQEVPLYLLLNSYREKLESIAEDMPLSEAFHRIGASDEAIGWLQANTLAGLLGNGFETNSTHAVLDFLKQYDKSTSFYAIRGGNDQLAQAFANELKGHILLNHRVQKIEQLKEKCILKGETFTIEAKRVIVAIPLSEVKKIEITPSLSLEKQAAIENIPYTFCARMSMIAPAGVFDAPPRAGVFLFSDSLGWFREQTLFQMDPNKKTVLNVSVVGSRAEELSSSREEWKEAVDAALSKLYPNWNPELTEYYTHVWTEGYSYFSANKNAQQNSLRKVEGRIHFAGEHTSDKFSSMNGALESGIRVAKEIQQDFLIH